MFRFYSFSLRPLVFGHVRLGGILGYLSRKPFTASTSHPQIFGDNLALSHGDQSRLLILFSQHRSGNSHTLSADDDTDNSTDDDTFRSNEPACEPRRHPLTKQNLRGSYHLNPVTSFISSFGSRSSLPSLGLLVATRTLLHSVSAVAIRQFSSGGFVQQHVGYQEAAAIQPMLDPTQSQVMNHSLARAAQTQLVQYRFRLDVVRLEIVKLPSGDKGAVEKCYRVMLPRTALATTTKLVGELENCEPISPFAMLPTTYVVDHSFGTLLETFSESQWEQIWAGESWEHVSAILVKSDKLLIVISKGRAASEY